MNDQFNIRERLLVGLAIRGAGGQLRQLRDVGLVFLTPVNDDLVFPLTFHFQLQIDDTLRLATHLFYLIGLRFVSLWLKIDDLLDTLLGENMMIAANTFHKT